MNKKIFWLAVVAVLASFAGGFLLANSLNRKELSALRAENDSLQKAMSEAAQNDDDESLSDEEIRRRIDEADKNPTNIAFQKNLGLALYNYAAMKQNPALLREVSRLVTRVYQTDANDYEAVTTLGNINLALGFYEKNNENFVKAREFYKKALEKKADDADVRTDLGLTFLLANPPENDAAIAEFERALKINAKNEKTLQGLIEALENQDKKEEAEKYAARLREINPGNEIFIETNQSAETKPENAQGDLQKK